MDELIETIMTLCAYIGLFSIVATAWIVHVILTREPRRRNGEPSGPLPSTLADATLPSGTQDPSSELVGSRRVSFQSTNGKRLSIDTCSTHSSLESQPPATPSSGDGHHFWRSHISIRSHGSSGDVSPVYHPRTPRLALHFPIKRRSATLPAQGLKRRAASTLGPMSPILSTPLSPVPMSPRETPSESIPLPESPGPMNPTLFPEPTITCDSDTEVRDKRPSRALQRVMQHLRYRRARSASTSPDDVTEVAPPASPDTSTAPAPRESRPRIHALVRKLTHRSRTSSSSPPPFALKPQRTDPYGPLYNAPPPGSSRRYSRYPSMRADFPLAEPSKNAGQESSASASPLPREGWSRAQTPASPAAHTQDTDLLMRTVTQKLSNHVLREQAMQQMQVEKRVSVTY